MSRRTRPMRAWKPASLPCQTCGQPLKVGELGGWTHVRKLLLRDWHPAKP
jgi:hypothetical protein